MPVVAAAVLAALYLVLDPPSADLAAQVYRVGLAEREGLAAWDNGWYAGHHLPAYSVLFPVLAAVLGLETVGAVCLIGATWAFSRLVSSRAAATWFAVAVAAALVSGRLTFALGVATGTAAVVAMVRGRSGWAALGGVATALGSPVASLFLALVATAAAVARPDLRRAGMAAAAGAAGVTLALVVVFPEGGSEPFVASAFWPALAAAVAATALTRGPVRVAAALWGALLVAAFVLPTPLGGNASRLGPLLGGPLLLAVGRDRRLLAAAALPLAYWTLYPAVRDWSQAAGDPARHAAYHRPLLHRLAREPGVVRLEIPFTAGHWEAAHVAPSVPLARGWERQLDRKVNAVFYEGALTPARYEAWLRDTAVTHVALPDVALDRSARAEAALIRAGTPALREVWRDEHWRLFAVRSPTPLGARDVGTDRFRTRGGLVRVRWSPHWAIVEGAGCVRQAAGGWTLVEPRPSGAEVAVGIRVHPLRALSGGARCR